MRKTEKEYADEGLSILFGIVCFVALIGGIWLALKEYPKPTLFAAGSMTAIVILLITGYYLCVGLGMAAERIRNHYEEWQRNRQ